MHREMVEYRAISIIISSSDDRAEGENGEENNSFFLCRSVPRILRCSRGRDTLSQFVYLLNQKYRWSKGGEAEVGRV